MTTSRLAEQESALRALYEQAIEGGQQDVTTLAYALARTIAAISVHAPTMAIQAGFLSRLYDVMQREGRGLYIATRELSSTEVLEVFNPTNTND